MQYNEDDMVRAMRFYGELRAAIQKMEARSTDKTDPSDSYPSFAIIDSIKKLRYYLPGSLLERLGENFEQLEKEARELLDRKRTVSSDQH